MASNNLASSSPSDFQPTLFTNLIATVDRVLAQNAKPDSFHRALGGFPDVHTYYADQAGR
jgi:hypothetical protein